MLVLIDESGCPGFKFPRGSDPIFAIGMVIFDTGDDARRVDKLILDLHEGLRHRSEFKFAKCSAEVRDGFFAAVATQKFRVRALLVRKEELYSTHLRSQPDAFYSYFVKQLLANDDGVLAGARIRIDGSGDREFRRALTSYLRREVGEKMFDVKLSDSKRDQLMQLADMCIGAIARSARDRKDASRWRDMLRPRIADVWDFR